MASVQALQAQAREISFGPLLGGLPAACFATWLPDLLFHFLLLLHVPGPIGQCFGDLQHIVSWL